MKKSILVLLFCWIALACQTAKPSIELDMTAYTQNYRDLKIEMDGQSIDWTEVSPTREDVAGDSKGETDMKAIYSFVSTDKIFFLMAEAYNDFLPDNSSLEIKTYILYQDGSTKVLGLNIKSDKTYSCWVDEKEVFIPGGEVAWGDVVEFMLPVSVIKNAVSIEATFGNIWINQKDRHEWLDIVGQ